jgi:hypothetical protein
VTRSLAIAGLLCTVTLAGCGVGSSPSPQEVARDADKFCAGHVRQIAPLAGAFGKTHGVVIVCDNGTTEAR